MQLDVLRAFQIKETANPKVVTESMRQGDVVVRRVGDAPETAKDFPEGGDILVSGTHGAHVILAPVGTWDEKTKELVLPVGGTIIHTDEPTARHAAGFLVPGIWTVDRQRELAIDLAIVPVVD